MLTQIVLTDIDLLHRGVCNDLLCQRRSIGPVYAKIIENTIGKPGLKVHRHESTSQYRKREVSCDTDFFEDFADDCLRTGCDLRRLQDNSVTTYDRDHNSTHG